MNKSESLLLHLLYFRRIKRRLILLVSFLILAIGNLFLLSNEIFLQLPNIISQKIDNNPALDLNKIKFQTKIFPYPHFYVEEIKMKLHGYGNLYAQGVSITLNLWSILFEKRKKLSNVSVRHLTFHTLKPKKKKYSYYKPFKYKKNRVERIVKAILKITNTIKSNLDHTDELSINTFNLFISANTSQKPFITGKNIEVKDFDYLSSSAIIEFDAYFHKWQTVNFAMKINRRTIKSKIVEIANIKIRATANFENLFQYFPIKASVLTGTVDTKIDLKYDITNYKAKFDINFIVNQVRITNKNKKQNFTAGIKKPLSIRWSGQASAKEIKNSVLTISDDDESFQAMTNWLFKTRDVSLKFNKKSLFKLNFAASFLGNYLPKYFYHLTNSSLGSIKPVEFIYNPVNFNFFYKFYFFVSPNIVNNKHNYLSIQGVIKGDANKMSSKYIYVKMGKSSASFYNLEFLLNGKAQLRAYMIANINLPMMFNNSRGQLGIKSYLVCNFANSIYCFNNNFYLSAKKIGLPMGLIANLYKFLQFSSPKDSNILYLNNLEANGILKGNDVLLQKSLMSSKLGRIKLRGKVNINAFSGKFKMLLTPNITQNPLLPRANNSVIIGFRLNNGKLRMSQYPRWLK